MLKSNAEELASIAQEIGAEVMRGPVRYPGHDAGMEVNVHTSQACERKQSQSHDAVACGTRR
jgi:hypothetical protein